MSGSGSGGGVRARILERFTVRGEVVEVEPLAARMRRVRLAGEGLVGLAYRAGQQVRVHVDGLTTRRTYSVWWYDPVAGALDLCVYDHGGEGPGARWERAVRVGETVHFGRPEGSFVLRPGATHHVFVGEETASVAFGPMLGAVADPGRVHGCVETATEAGRLPLTHADRLVWPVRGDASAEASAGLADAVRRLDLPDPAGGAAYVAGEARTVQLIRQVLVRERGWDRKSVLTKPFWAPGKRGME